MFTKQMDIEHIESGLDCRYLPRSKHYNSILSLVLSLQQFNFVSFKSIKQADDDVNIHFMFPERKKVYLRIARLHRHLMHQ